MILSNDQSMAREVADAQVRMFAMFVGPGRLVTRAALSAASRVPASTLKEWANGAAMPIHGLLTLRRFLPAEAINMLIEPGDCRMVHADAQQSNWDAIAALSARVTAGICEARADGHIDHVEDARLKTKLRGLIAEAQGLVESG